MSDDLNQIHNALGAANGKLDSLIVYLRDYIAQHDERHTKIDTKLETHADAISQAKGAKGAIIAVAGVVSGGVALLVSKVGKLLQ